MLVSNIYWNHELLNSTQLLHSTCYYTRKCWKLFTQTRMVENFVRTWRSINWKKAQYNKVHTIRHKHLLTRPINLAYTKLNRKHPYLFPTNLKWKTSISIPVSNVTFFLYRAASPSTKSKTSKINRQWTKNAFEYEKKQFEMKCTRKNHKTLKTSTKFMHF